MKIKPDRLTIFRLVPWFLGISFLGAADPDDAALLTNPVAVISSAETPPPQADTSALAPLPGSKLAQAFAKIAKANESFAAELAPLIEKFPTYTQSGMPFHDSIRISGSDSMGALLVRAASSYKSIYPEAGIEVHQGGSMKGLQELQAGNCEMASVSRELSPEEVTRIEKVTGKKVFSVSVALGAVCVYVNADNPINGLTKAQCNGLFSIEHSMTADPIIRWKQLDPSSPFGSTSAPLYVENILSGTLQLFKDWCMPGENITTINRFIEPGPSAVVNACCAYPSAIGIAGFAYRQPRVKAVPLALSPGGPYVAPSITTIRNGSYPMRQRMNLVLLARSKEQIPPMARDFLRFLLSQDGQDMVAKIGLIPVDPAGIPSFLGEHAKGHWH